MLVNYLVKLEKLTWKLDEGNGVLWTPLFLFSFSFPLVLSFLLLSLSVTFICVCLFWCVFVSLYVFLFSVPLFRLFLCILCLHSPAFLFCSRSFSGSIPPALSASLSPTVCVFLFPPVFGFVPQFLPIFVCLLSSPPCFPF
jgi:hypothetical protein